jgi:hypothetical protein
MVSLRLVWAGYIARLCLKKKKKKKERKKKIMGLWDAAQQLKRTDLL